jgi:putative hydrolase of the HAD superfamily
MLQCICLDWGGTLMHEDGPAALPMALWPQVQAVAGAQATLAALARHWPLHIATNAAVSTPLQVQLALQRVGLAGFIQQIFCAPEIGARKDEAAFWQAVQIRTGVPLTAMAMVGDSLAQDVLGPARCGLHTVWFHPDAGHTLPPPGIAQVARLPDLVPHFLARRW